MELYLLRQLAVFAEKGTLSRAAEALHISQPALSRSMKKIEEELGVPLFDRSKSRIALNETGKVAAKYALRVLEAEQEMREQTLAFERNRRTLSIGACAALPINLLLPLLQQQFKNMAITTEICPDRQLLTALRGRTCQIAIVHEKPEEPLFFSMQYLEEQLYVTFPPGHPLASRKSLSFRDLKGISILAHGGAGFWLDICRRNLDETRLLIQDSIDALEELTDASTLPAFASSQTALLGYDRATGRTAVPLSDTSARADYYLVCLREEKERFLPFFAAASEHTP